MVWGCGSPVPGSVRAELCSTRWYLSRLCSLVALFVFLLHACETHVDAVDWCASRSSMVSSRSGQCSQTPLSILLVLFSLKYGLIGVPMRGRTCEHGCRGPSTVRKLVDPNRPFDILKHRLALIGSRVSGTGTGRV